MGAAPIRLILALAIALRRFDVFAAIRGISGRLVARLAVRFGAVVDCSALEDGLLISVLAGAPCRGAVRIGKIPEMSVAYLSIMGWIPFRSSN